MLARLQPVHFRQGNGCRPGFPFLTGSSSKSKFPRRCVDSAIANHKHVVSSVKRTRGRVFSVTGTWTWNRLL